MANTECKACSRCKQPKQRSDFSPDTRARDGLQSACRDCCGRAAKVRYDTDPGPFKARSHRRYHADPEAARKANRIQAIRHSAKNTARAVAWIKANRERFRANMKASEARRRSAEKAGATGPETRAWFKAQKKACHWCGINCSADPVIDHIAPIAKGGKHELRNLAISCRSCNARKGARDPIEWAQMIGKLL